MSEYDITQAFKRIEDELIGSMIRNLERHKTEEGLQGMNWSMWQVEQLKSLEKYKAENHKKYGKAFAVQNKKIEDLIRMAKSEGGMSQEAEILKQIKNGFTGYSKNSLSGNFFRLNERKLETLINATVSDMKKAETAILRMSNDKYRQVIFNAQMYANSGAGTYQKAVDMATKDMLSAGLNCVEYKNGARHTLPDYSDMAIRTASKRAYLQGEGIKRQEWGISTVIINKRGNPCNKCLPFVGKVLIDDVWSGGKASDGDYPLMSDAIAKGLYHPRCKDSHSTFFPGISTEDNQWTKEELKDLQRSLNKTAAIQYAIRQAEKYERLSKYSLDEENKMNYERKALSWNNNIDLSEKNDILNKEPTKEDIEVHIVGKINRDIYKCITKDIITDEVIITDERILHIKERHPNDYDRFSAYIPEIISNPDFIIEANKPNTAVVLKEIVENNEKYQLVLRIKTAADAEAFKNSVITFLNINDRTWNKYLRNKRILYKKE